jgi:hypothetical protein
MVKTCAAKKQDPREARPPRSKTPQKQEPHPTKNRKGAPNIGAPFPIVSLVQAPRAPLAKLTMSLAGGLSEVTAL